MTRVFARLRRSFATTAPRATILIRFLVGAVFVSEGIQKFLYPQILGVGRFTKIGIPIPEIAAPFVGLVEIVCGLMILIGLATRLVAVPLIVDMLVAIGTTKFPILVRDGFWRMLHEVRTDYAMLLALLFLLIVGAGPISLDARIGPKRNGSVNRSSR